MRHPIKYTRAIDYTYIFTVRSENLIWLASLTLNSILLALSLLLQGI